MPKLSMFNSISLDGYFTDAKNDMSWAHQRAQDPEWDDFVKGNASGKGRLLFGRVTYQMMEAFWPNQGIQMMPEVAKGMTASPKVVFSRTLDKVTWENTVLLKGDLVEEVKKLKSAPGPDMVILGSGSIVAQLAKENLIDQYQIVISPIALGAGRTLFEGLKKNLGLKLVK
ncbi:MAG TPA: dihydrofolate reductase family protein, partial [bacterium]|nr:dihydrofolate reductase family protein [bacterium]